MPMFFKPKSRIKSTAGSFEEFLLENRKKTNQILNTVLWSCTITGPAISIGVAMNFFKNISYLTCILISIFLILCAAIHKYLCKVKASSSFTSLFALISLDLLIIHMSIMNINICLTFFLVPVLSLLFVDKKLFHLTTLFNYAVMFLSVYLVSKYRARFQLDYETPLQYFKYIIGGYTIETIILFFAANAISKSTITYLKQLYENQKLLLSNEALMNEQLDILNSMSEIYKYMNLIDFENSAIISYEGGSTKTEKVYFDEKPHSELCLMISETILIDQIQKFKDFTDLTTIRSRMIKKKIISAEFLNTTSGWFRVQFISIQQGHDNTPVRLIFTIQDIDEEKKEQETLKKISNTDQLTRLYNRRAYDDDVKVYDGKEIEEDFVLLSIDVNGLKQVNDNQGHNAGDELLQGASFAMQAIFGHMGKVYRTGGDEFLVIIHTKDDVEELKNQLKKITKNWHGNIVDSLSVSIGYARKFDYPKAGIHELEKYADEKMYIDKEAYYLSKGIDRKGQQVAYATICESFTTILRINLQDETFSIIKNNPKYFEIDSTLDPSISYWIQDYADKELIHEEDKDYFLEKIDIDYIRSFFQKGYNNLSIFYRHKTKTGYQKAMMELIKTEDFSPSKPQVFLYVRKMNQVFLQIIPYFTLF